MINLSEKYPNYFNKKILRITLILCLIFSLYLFAMNGFQFKSIYIECTAEEGCLNPFYTCNEFGMFCNKDPYCNKHPEFCQATTLKQGEIIGDKNFLLQNNNQISLLIIVLGFMINHYYYKVKYGKKNNN